MTAHIDLDELLTIRAVTVVDTLPLFEDWVEFVPIGTSLESQCVGEGRRTQRPLASLIDAPILAFPTETGQYILDTDASNFGLGGVLSQMQNDQERVVAYCSRALRPSQRRYCTTKARCWRWWPCAYSLDPICVEHVLLSGRIISRWCGYIVLKIRRACCHDGCIPCNNSSSPLYTGQERTMGMLMAFHALHHRHVDSARVQTAHRPL